MSSHLCSDNSGYGFNPNHLPIPQELKNEWNQQETRRHFLGSGGKALAWAGLASLLGKQAFAMDAAIPGAAGALGQPHFKPRAKRVIYLFMSGGPPQMDMWDYKPDLAKMYNQDLPESVRGKSIPTGMTASQSRFPIAPSHWKFKQYGQSGRWASDLIPHTAKLADDIAVINSMRTDAINHEPAILQMNTGNMIPGKPSLGAWLAYGLGSPNENLPSFVVLNSKEKSGNQQPINSRLWGSGFLSSRHAGVLLRAAQDPVLYLKNPKGMDAKLRRAMIDAVGQLNEKTFQETNDPETQSRISQYEMAFRMQTSVPELTDLSDEPESTWKLYGPSAKDPGTFTYNCLMARRLAERGVPFTQVYKRGWDVHGNVVGVMPQLCGESDAACYALVTDLKQRGLLDDTLVVWGGEFGRTVYSQGGLSRKNYGRDHHGQCFSMWMAGGGVKPGIQYGKTDEFSHTVVENPVHVNDLNATILHCLGIDHHKLTYKFQGLEQKLTGVKPCSVRHELLS